MAFLIVEQELSTRRINCKAACASVEWEQNHYRLRGAAPNSGLWFWQLSFRWLVQLRLWQDDSSVEYQVKAAFLYNFAKFVEWPRDAFQSDQTPIILCLFGYGPFGGALDELVRGKAINGRELLARPIKDLPDLKMRQLVFVRNVPPQHWEIAEPM